MRRPPHFRTFKKLLDQGATVAVRCLKSDSCYIAILLQTIIACHPWSIGSGTVRKTGNLFEWIGCLRRGRRKPDAIENGGRGVHVFGCLAWHNSAWTLGELGDSGLVRGLWLVLIVMIAVRLE